MSNEIGKRYGRLVVIEKTEKRYRSTTIYKCRCDCGNIVELTINKLHSGHTKSCGWKNEENRAALPNLDRGLVDGTMKCGIKKDKKLNKNNTSGVRGVHFDKDRGL